MKGHPLQALEGESLLSIFEGKDRPHPSPIFWEHEGNRAVRLQEWKLVSRQGRDWELYNLDTDRTEQNNLVTKRPDKLKELSDLYAAWARRCNVVPFESLPRERRTIPADENARQTAYSHD
jgi:arylsulfatase A-like enzyme